MFTLSAVTQSRLTEQRQPSVADILDSLLMMRPSAFSVIYTVNKHIINYEPSLRHLNSPPDIIASRQVTNLHHISA